MELQIVKFVKTSRNPQGCLYASGEVAGFPVAVARRLVAVGEAVLWDAGAGPGTPVPGAPHAREVWEKDDDAVWLRRKASVEAAMKPAEIAKREAQAAEGLAAQRAHNEAHDAERSKARA